ncbi:MAG: laccase domain-containing protein [Parabacteroides merdae]
MYLEARCRYAEKPISICGRPTVCNYWTEGLSAGNIELAGICTYAHPDEFFSARRLGIKSGRILSGIFLRGSSLVYTQRITPKWMLFIRF